MKRPFKSFLAPFFEEFILSRQAAGLWSNTWLFYTHLGHPISQCMGHCILSKTPALLYYKRLDYRVHQITAIAADFFKVLPFKNVLNVVFESFFKDICQKNGYYHDFLGQLFSAQNGPDILILQRANYSSFNRGQLFSKPYGAENINLMGQLFSGILGPQCG